MPDQTSTSFGNIAVGLATFAVAVVLLLGLLNLARGGSANLSQKLMRWRVILQFFAIAVIVVVMLFRAR